MVLHIVMWKLKDFAEGASRAENAVKIKKGLEDLVGVVPGLLKLNVYDGFSDDCDICLVSELQDRDALDTYQNYPEHVEIAKFIRAVVDKRAAFDAEVV